LQIPSSIPGRRVDKSCALVFVPYRDIGMGQELFVVLGRLVCLDPNEKRPCMWVVAAVVRVFWWRLMAVHTCTRGHDYTTGRGNHGGNGSLAGMRLFCKRSSTFTYERGRVAYTLMSKRVTPATHHQQCR
jgi:hypothetical protein